VWFRPVLLLAGVLMVVPVTVRRTPPDLLVPLVGLVGLVGITGTVAWLARGRLWGVHRTRVGWVLLAGAGVVLLTVAAVALPDRPEHALPFAVAVAVAVSPARRTRLRLPFQATVVVAVTALLVRADRPLLEVGVAVFLLVFAVWLAGTLAQSFVDARRRQLTARREAERRAELLSAVEALSTRDPSDAARTVVDSLRSLGYSVAGVSLERDGVLVPIALEGLPPAPGLEVGEGLAGAALAENRTLVVDDYRADPRSLPGREDLGAAIVVPIRSGETPVGVVLGGRQTAGPLPAAEVEVAEVLAAHLGGVLETEQTMHRQRELLARMQSLETMRERLLTEVSEEVRDPLTIVRGIAETLAAHQGSLSEEQRTRLLAGFVEQTRSLRATIDALLDFSRLQAARPLPTLGLFGLAELLAPVADGADVEGDPEAVVRTDPLLLGRALETVASIGQLRRVLVTPDGSQVTLRLELEPATALQSASLLLGLAERLVVTVGGSWSLEPGAVEVSLPRAPAGVAEAS
jgi:K+-sensing histidine kinase KdpD